MAQPHDMTDDTAVQLPMELRSSPLQAQLHAAATAMFLLVGLVGLIDDESSFLTFLPLAIVFGVLGAQQHRDRWRVDADGMQKNGQQLVRWAEVDELVVSRDDDLRSVGWRDADDAFQRVPTAHLRPVDNTDDRQPLDVVLAHAQAADIRVRPELETERPSAGRRVAVTVLAVAVAAAVGAAGVLLVTQLG